MLVKMAALNPIKGYGPVNKYKLEERRVYYEATGHFPLPVLLDKSNRIIDGYTSYVVAKEMELDEMECTYDISEYEYDQNKKVRMEFNSSYSWELKKMVYKKSGGTCAICGQALSVNNFNIDHWKPISQGGTNELENLVATHKACNRLKNDFIAEDFFKRMTTIIAYQSRQNGEIAKNVIHDSIRLVFSIAARKIRLLIL